MTLDRNKPNATPDGKPSVVRAHFPGNRVPGLEHQRLLAIMKEAIWTEFTKWERSSSR